MEHVGHAPQLWVIGPQRPDPISLAQPTTFAPTAKEQISASFHSAQSVIVNLPEPAHLNAKQE